MKILVRDNRGDPLGGRGCQGFRDGGVAARDGFYRVEKDVVLLRIERAAVLRALPEFEIIIGFWQLQLASIH